MVNKTLHGLRRINPGGFIIKFKSLTTEAREALTAASQTTIRQLSNQTQTFRELNRPTSVFTVTAASGRQLIAETGEMEQKRDEKRAEERREQKRGRIWPSILATRVLPPELAQQTTCAPSIALPPRYGFEVKQLRSSAIYLFIPYMSHAANVSAAGDVSPPEPVFTMRDCPLWKSYEKIYDSFWGFGLGAARCLQLA